MTSSETVEMFYVPNDSTLCTKTFWTFLDDYKTAIDAFYFMIHLAHRSDFVALTAAKALVEHEPDEEKKKELEEAIKNPNRAMDRLTQFKEINSRNISTNTAECFLWYVSNIIQASMKRRPEMIKSGESIKVEEIFNYSNKRELVNFLIDKKVHSLSYGGLTQIQKYLEETLGIKPYREDRDSELLKVFIEIRNIQAHNRGIVNKIFLKRAGEVVHKFDLDFHEGKLAHLKYDDLIMFSRCCVETALHIDQQAAKKFGIERKKLSTWAKGKSA